MIINGKLVRGASNAAGEIGHIKLQMHGGPLCGCGDEGCLEAFASGPSIVAMAEDYIKGGKSAKFREIANGAPITPVSYTHLSKKNVIRFNKVFKEQIRIFFVTDFSLLTFHFSLNIIKKENIKCQHSH